MADGRGIRTGDAWAAGWKVRAEPPRPGWSGIGEGMDRDLAVHDSTGFPAIGGDGQDMGV